MILPFPVEVGMRAFMNILSGFLAWLCRAFEVRSEIIADGRRGNLPPPSGGIASF